MSERNGVRRAAGALFTGAAMIAAGLAGGGGALAGAVAPAPSTTVVAFPCPPHTPIIKG